MVHRALYREFNYSKRKEKIKAKTIERVEHNRNKKFFPNLLAKASFLIYIEL